MTFLCSIIFITITMQSYFIISKLNIENKKIYFFLLNLILLITGSFYYNISSYENYKMDLYDNFAICMFFILDLISVIEYIYIIKRTPNKKYIKQAIDESKDGIMALSNEGKIIFQNNTMFNLINKLNIYEDYKNKIEEKSIEKVENDFIIMVDGEAWLFAINDEETEFTAFNINEQYKLNLELKEKNRILEKNNEKVMWTIEHIEELEKEEKTLKLKNKYHDVLGNNLSILQAYLNQDELDEKKFDEIKFMIKKMFIELDDNKNPKEKLEDLLKINKNLGININIDGVLPDNKEIAQVFFEIIREGITNAIKHSNSEEIDIKIEDNILGKVLTISNDVDNPKDTIIENDGIKGMRRKVKNIGGKIYINPKPRFSIRVEI